MTTFTKEQLAEIKASSASEFVYGRFRASLGDLAAFALSLWKRAENAEARCDSLSVDLDAERGACNDAKAERDEARRELAEARQYGPKWWPSEEEIEDGWEETEFYDNDFSHVLIFVVPPTPSGRRALERKEGA